MEMSCALAKMSVPLKEEDFLEEDNDKVKGIDDDELADAMTMLDQRGEVICPLSMMVEDAE